MYGKYTLMTKSQELYGVVHLLTTRDDIMYFDNSCFKIGLWFVPEKERNNRE